MFRMDTIRNIYEGELNPRNHRSFPATPNPSKLDYMLTLNANLIIALQSAYKEYHTDLSSHYNIVGLTMNGF